MLTPNEAIWGSSPRMRGAGIGSPHLQVVFGIIPAHAGSRASAYRTSTSRTDHPRACGEQPSVAIMRGM